MRFLSPIALAWGFFFLALTKVASIILVEGPIFRKISNAEQCARRNIQITANSVIDTQSNNLGRYGMLTLTYNIQNFGQKVGGRQTFFNF